MLLDFFYNLIFSHSTLIIPRLWLGDCNASMDKDFLKTNNINVVINCTPYLPFYTEVHKDINTDNDDKDDEDEIKTLNIRLSVYDSQLEKDIILMEQYLYVILPKLIELYNDNDNNILIHCRAGKQRSAIVVSALLFALTIKKNISWDNIDIENIDKQELSETIFKYIMKLRPQAFTFGYKYNFMKSFKRVFNIQ